jgi:uncharacterized protein with GYD domain
MPTYISLCNFTDQGIRGIKEAPNRAQKADELARKLGCGFTAYPTIGPYDLVIVLEAPDDKAATRFFLAMGATGNLRTTTLRAIPREEFLEIASSLE